MACDPTAQRAIRYLRPECTALILLAGQNTNILASSQTPQRDSGLGREGEAGRQRQTAAIFQRNRLDLVVAYSLIRELEPTEGRDQFLQRIVQAAGNHLLAAEDEAVDRVTQQQVKAAAPNPVIGHQEVASDAFADPLAGTGRNLQRSIGKGLQVLGRGWDDP